MELKKLNEELRRVLNELSTETRQWAVDTRKSRYLAAQATADREKEKFEKTQRLEKSLRPKTKEEVKDTFKEIETKLSFLTSDFSGVQESNGDFFIILKDVELEDGKLTASAEKQLEKLLKKMTEKYGCKYSYTIEGTRVKIICEKPVIQSQKDRLINFGYNELNAMIAEYLPPFGEIKTYHVQYTIDNKSIPFFTHLDLPVHKCLKFILEGRKILKKYSNSKLSFQCEVPWNIRDRLEMEKEIRDEWNENGYIYTPLFIVVTDLDIDTQEIKEKLNSLLKEFENLYDKLNESEEYTFADWFGEDLTGQTYDGNIDCSYQGLTSLYGTPKIVNGDFYCHGNELTSLEGAPQTVNGYFYCPHNQLTSLKGAPLEVGGNFTCDYNPNLKSLDGIGEVRGKIISDLN